MDTLKISRDTDAHGGANFSIFKTRHMLLCRSNCITVMSYYKAVKKKIRNLISGCYCWPVFYHKYGIKWICNSISSGIFLKWKLKWHRELSVKWAICFDSVTNTAYNCFTSLACIFFKQLKQWLRKLYNKQNDYSS